MKKLKLISINSLIAFSFLIAFVPAFLTFDGDHFLSFSSQNGKNYVVLEHLDQHSDHEHNHEHEHSHILNKAQSTGFNVNHFKDHGDHVIELPDFDLFAAQISRLNLPDLDLEINQELFTHYFVSLPVQAKVLARNHFAGLVNSQLLQLNTVRLLF